MKTKYREYSPAQSSNLLECSRSADQLATATTLTHTSRILDRTVDGFIELEDHREAGGRRTRERITAPDQRQSDLAKREDSGRNALMLMPRDAIIVTKDAALLLCRSVSWLLRQGDIPYRPGRPNQYRVGDLLDWFEANKHNPLD